MKYDSQLSNLKDQLLQAKAVLIAIPSNASVDELAGSLALYLSLKQAQKSAAIVSESTLKVSHTNLFGVGDIKSEMPQTGSGGNFVLTLGGVTGADGKPLLEGVNYSMQGSDLNLVFPVAAGQRYEPTFITPKYEGSKYDLIFVVGAKNLEELGNVYTKNQEMFKSSQLVNIDNSQDNSQFGATNVVDQAASGVSQMMGYVFESLSLPNDADIATNIITGVYDVTGNLQNNITSETFEVLAKALKNGGQKSTNMNSSMDTSTQQPAQTPAPVSIDQSQSTSGFDISQLYKPGGSDNLTTPPTIGGGPNPETAPAQVVQSEDVDQSSPEEIPSGEGVITPEEDWLTPKIYSGKSIG